ncbi:hypothetical protein D9M68_496280 [compost metagenome]
MQGNIFRLRQHGERQQGKQDGAGKVDHDGGGAVVVAQQNRGCQRRDGSRHHRRDLIAKGCARIAHGRRENFGKIGGLRPIAQRLAKQAQADDAQDLRIRSRIQSRKVQERPDQQPAVAKRNARLASDLIGQITAEQHGEELKDVRDEHEEHHGLRRQLGVHRKIGDRKHYDDVIRRVLAHAQQDAEERLARIGSQCILKRSGLLARLLLPLVRFEEDRRVLHRSTYVVANKDDRGRQPERHTPAPVEKGVLGQQRRKAEQYDGGKHITDACSRLRIAGPIASLMRRRMF